MTGEGQHVDLSIQASLAQATYMLTSAWDMQQTIRQRQLQEQNTVRRNMMPTRVWPCKDGYVMWFFFPGEAGKRRNPPLVEWMDSEGMADDFIKEIDWETFGVRPEATDEPPQETPQERMERFRERGERLGEPTGQFFLAHTKQELMEGAIKYRVTLYPLLSTEEILESAQLAARGFWVEVEHPELDTTITYPGAFVQASEMPPRIWHRAPLIGEHNQEVYEQELDISADELLRLKQARVI